MFCNVTTKLNYINKPQILKLESSNNLADKEDQHKKGEFLVDLFTIYSSSKNNLIGYL
jgi:hypothetical protein